MIPLKFVSLTFTKFQFISNQHMHLFCLKNGDGIEKPEYAYGGGGGGSRERGKRNNGIVVLFAKMKVCKNRVLVSTFAT
jgi:hypothetical protein